MIRSDIHFAMASALVGLSSFYFGRWSAPERIVPIAIEPACSETATHAEPVPAITHEPPLIEMTPALEPIVAPSAVPVTNLPARPPVILAGLAPAPVKPPSLSPDPIVLEEIPDNPYRVR